MDFPGLAKADNHMGGEESGWFLKTSWVKCVLFCCYSEVQFLTINDLLWGFPGGTSGKESACQCRRHIETQVQSLGREDPLEEGMTIHFSILAWRIPWTEGLASDRL